MSGMAWRGAAVVAAMALVAAACADDGGEPISAPSTTERPTDVTSTSEATTTTTTTTTTTDGATSTTAVATTTTEAVPSTTVPAEPAEFPYWSTACAEVAGDVGATYAADPGLAEFTTLGAVPALDLVMPQVVTSAGPYGSIAATSPIPGGVLVGVYPPDGWPTADEVLHSSSLVAVNDDGSIRWRRCFGEDVETRRFAVAPASLEPEVAWVLTTAWDEPLRIVGVDLATGADVEFPMSPDALARLREVGYGSSRFVVIGRPYDGGPAAPDDRLVVVDAIDGSVAHVPVPPNWIGNTSGTAYVVDDPTHDGYVLLDAVPYGDEILAAFTDGAWTDDPSVLRDVVPSRVTETFGEPFELRLIDGAGDLVWSVPEFHGINREGFRWAVADDVVIAVRCAEWDADGSCTWTGDGPPDEETVGFDLSTGEQLWVRPGGAAVPVIAGNRAIVTAPDGYVLLDLVTGERIGDLWPEGSFAQECCGGDAYVNVRRDGGVVIATDMDHVRVWYPPELTAPTVTVDLMG